MPDTEHTPYAASVTNALTTQLNSLANNANSAESSAIDNRTDCHLFHDLVLVLASVGANRTAGMTVAVYMTVSLDETNYDTAGHENMAPVAVFTMDAATAARRFTARDVPIPPGLFKYFVRNISGQAFAASGNTLGYRAHSLRSS